MNLKKNYHYIIYYFIFTVCGFSQSINWVKDDFALDPTGINLTNLIIPNDIDNDSENELLVLIENKIQILKKNDPGQLPYFIKSESLTNGLPEYFSTFSVADLDGDKRTEIVTITLEPEKHELVLNIWKCDSLNNWTLDKQPVKDFTYTFFQNSTAPFFYDTDFDGDQDMIFNSLADFSKVNLRFIENIGDRYNAVWKEDSTRMELVNKSPVGYESFSPVLMRVNQDSLPDLVLISVTEGMFDIIMYPGVLDSTGYRWSNKYETILKNYQGQIKTIWPDDMNNDGLEDLIVVDGQNLCRVYLATGQDSRYFDQNYFLFGSLPANDINQVNQTSFAEKGSQLLVPYIYPAWPYMAIFFQIFQKQKMNEWSLWRSTKKLKTIDGLSCWQYKYQFNDLDNNGLTELVYSEEFCCQMGFFFIYESADTLIDGNWSYREDLLIPFLGVRHDTLYLDPNFADMDGDGDPDLMIRQKTSLDEVNYSQKYLFYENTDAHSTGWQARPDWKQGIDSVYTYSTMADLDADGDADLIFKMEKDTSLVVFQNCGHINSPVWVKWENIFNNISVSENTRPSFVDYNNDGRMDLILKSKDNKLNLFYNKPEVNDIAQPTTQPRECRLWQNYPNPFNPVTTIRFDMPQSGFVELKIVNISGQEIETLVKGKKSAGAYYIDWNASKYASGVYIYQIKTGSFIDHKKLLLLK